MREGSEQTTRVRFLHHVGRSTLVQGITVPVSAQVGWLEEVRKGQRVPVEIRFGDGQSVAAVVRRINNARGHLQFRYEGRQQAPLRDYLAKSFPEQASEGSGLLEIVEVEPQVFEFRPRLAHGGGSPRLALYRPHFHNLSAADVRDTPAFRDIRACLSATCYDAQWGQAQYNSSIGRWLTGAGWRREVQVAPGVGLRCDFEKDGVWLEVEFGNARVYYQDYIKFLLALRHQGGRCGVLLAPTDAFAGLLCELGRERAAAKRRRAARRAPTYSGMMSYEKALRELPLLEFLLNAGIVIAGIDVERENLPATSPCN